MKWKSTRGSTADVCQGKESTNKEFHGQQNEVIKSKERVHCKVGD
jgi:hypothetical protein